MPDFLVPALKALWAGGRWLFTGDSSLSGKARAALGVFGVLYATSFVLSHWHNYWVGCKWLPLSTHLQYEADRASFPPLANYKQ